MNGGIKRQNSLIEINLRRSKLVAVFNKKVVLTDSENKMKMTVFKKMLLITLIAITGLIGFMTLSQFQVERVFTQTNYANTNIVPSIIALDKIRYKLRAHPSLRAQR